MSCRCFLQSLQASFLRCSSVSIVLVHAIILGFPKFARIGQSDRDHNRVVKVQLISFIHLLVITNHFFGNCCLFKFGMLSEIIIQIA